MADHPHRARDAAPVKTFSYDLMPERPAPMGLIVLKADETLEGEMRQAVEADDDLYVSRVPSAAEVTPESLMAMEDHITAAARILPSSRPYSVVGYGCTSASALIGPDRVAALVRGGREARAVTNPLSAALAYAAERGLGRIALLSPYIEEVNRPLMEQFETAGVQIARFATFNEPAEARVARISEKSLVEAGVALAQEPGIEGLFISCTNLRTRAVLPQIEDRIGKPAFSSNSALIWHMSELKNPD